MNKPPSELQTSFGFISVLEIEGLGHCGGLLIVSQIGRPIEFHCSAPVAANRAQKILYGKTYDGYLYCEQIGLALINKSKHKPRLYLANCSQLMGLNKLIDETVVVLEDNENRPEFVGQQVHRPSPIEVKGQTIWCPPVDADELTSIQKLTDSFTQSLPLDEPFERIQKAIDEAQAVAR